VAESCSLARSRRPRSGSSRHAATIRSTSLLSTPSRSASSTVAYSISSTSIPLCSRPPRRCRIFEQVCPIGQRGRAVDGARGVLESSLGDVTEPETMASPNIAVFPLRVCKSRFCETTSASFSAMRSIRFCVSRKELQNPLRSRSNREETSRISRSSCSVRARSTIAVASETMTTSFSNSSSERLACTRVAGACRPT